jgi:hypothetical protein
MKPFDQFLKDIQETKLTWIGIEKEPCFYEVIFQGEHVKFRLNDFPDEPPLTLFIRNEEIDLDEFPRGMAFPPRNVIP